MVPFHVRFDRRSSGRLRFLVTTVRSDYLAAYVAASDNPRTTAFIGWVPIQGDMQRGSSRVWLWYLIGAVSVACAIGGVVSFGRFGRGSCWRSDRCRRRRRRRDRRERPAPLFAVRLLLSSTASRDDPAPSTRVLSPLAPHRCLSLPAVVTARVTHDRLVALAAMLCGTTCDAGGGHALDAALTLHSGEPSWCGPSSRTRSSTWRSRSTTARRPARGAS